jgi:uncharacterized protein
MTCPICDRPLDPGYRPFCSRRCADADLGNWLNERYRLPADDAGEQDTPDAPTATGRPQ